MITGGELVYHTRKGEVLLVKKCLDNGVSINAKNKKGNTALIKAVFLQDVAMVVYLLSWKPDLSIRNKKGQTVFDVPTFPLLRELVEDYRQTGKIHTERMVLVKQITKRSNWNLWVELIMLTIWGWTIVWSLKRNFPDLP